MVLEEVPDYYQVALKLHPFFGMANTVLFRCGGVALTDFQWNHILVVELEALKG